MPMHLDSKQILRNQEEIGIMIQEIVYQDSSTKEVLELVNLKLFSKCTPLELEIVQYVRRSSDGKDQKHTCSKNLIGWFRSQHQNTHPPQKMCIDQKYHTTMARHNLGVHCVARKNHNLGPSFKDVNSDVKQITQRNKLYLLEAPQCAHTQVMVHNTTKLLTSRSSKRGRITSITYNLACYFLMLVITSMSEKESQA